MLTIGWFQSQHNVVDKIKTEIIKSLSLYYFTFVDIMDFKVGPMHYFVVPPLGARLFPVVSMIAVCADCVSVTGSDTSKDLSPCLITLSSAGSRYWSPDDHGCLSGLLWHCEYPVNHRSLHVGPVQIATHNWPLTSCLLRCLFCAKLSWFSSHLHLSFTYPLRAMWHIRPPHTSSTILSFTVTLTSLHDLLPAHVLPPPAFTMLSLARLSSSFVRCPH